jgi:hypothetical protein
VESGAFVDGLIKFLVAVLHADARDELFDDVPAGDGLQHDHGLNLGELLGVLRPGDGGGACVETDR